MGKVFLYFLEEEKDGRGGGGEGENFKNVGISLNTEGFHQI